LSDFNGETGRTRDINRREIDTQRRRSTESGGDDKNEQMHSVETYSNRTNCSNSKQSASEKIRVLMDEKEHLRLKCAANDGTEGGKEPKLE
jgi:hypothetical protein